MTMRLTPSMAVAAPIVFGVPAWWAVMLGAPLLLLRRRRRRPFTRHRCSLSATSSSNAISPLTASSKRERQSTARTGGGQPGRASIAADTAPRLSPATLEPLCRYVDFHCRLELAVSELERKLSRLPAERWRFDPYPLTGGRGNTLLILGETGVFVVSATYAPGHWDDVVVVNRLARKIQPLLPGYAASVQPAICYPFSSLQPRVWHRADEHGEWVGGWVLGGEAVIQWLGHFGSEHGFALGDLERFDELAKPNWLKPAIPTAPTWPPVPDRASSEPQE